MRRQLPHLIVALAFCVAALASPAISTAHQDGCHSAHSCPSDHHTYVWSDAGGASWDCVQQGAPDYSPATDTTTIVYAGRTYYCRSAGGTPVPPQPPQPPDTDADGIPDAQDACPTQAGPPPGGCPLPADADGDRVPDTTDACPTQPATTPNGCPVIVKPVDPVCHVNGPYPDKTCTPGTVFSRVTAKQVCRAGYSKGVRNVSEGTKETVFSRYGIAAQNGSTYEVDHFIPLELGGSNSIRNLFPEAAAPGPGFHEKDRLENALHRRVCAGRMTLKAAQAAIRRDWVAAFKLYVGGWDLTS